MCINFVKVRLMYTLLIYVMGSLQKALIITIVHNAFLMRREHINNRLTRHYHTLNIRAPLSI